MIVAKIVFFKILFGCFVAILAPFVKWACGFRG
jgi:hypothetical protein